MTKSHPLNATCSAAPRRPGHACSSPAAAIAQNVADVPRNETLVLTPWGDQPAQLANVDNWNPYLTPRSRISATPCSSPSTRSCSTPTSTTAS